MESKTPLMLYADDLEDLVRLPRETMHSILDSLFDWYLGAAPLPDCSTVDTAILRSLARKQAFAVSRLAAKRRAGSTRRHADATASPSPAPASPAATTPGNEWARFRDLLRDASASRDLAGALAMQFGRGPWQRYIAQAGADAVRTVAGVLAAEIAVGEIPNNPAAILTTRIKALIQNTNQPTDQP